MIAPRYMVCSEGRIIDRDTGLVSHINVIDKLLVTRGHGDPGQVLSALRFFISAVWATDEETPSEGQCEWEMLVSFPGQTEPQKMGSGEFQFTKPFQRIEVLFQGIFGTPPQSLVRLETGVLRISSHVRRKGDDEWLSQDYTIALDVVSASETHESISQAVESN